MFSDDVIVNVTVSPTLARDVSALLEAIVTVGKVGLLTGAHGDDEFSLVDSSIAPILWRLPIYGIELPSQAKPIHRYMDEVFSRPSFQASLTELEQEMRQ